ncbi:MAG: hypothetical protein ACYDCL_00410 [Myxococcales bacterium]
MPFHEAGLVAGLLFPRISPYSCWSLFGLRSGDVVLRVNGHPMGDAESALRAYRVLRGARRLRVEIQRRLLRLTLHFDVD